MTIHFRTLALAALVAACTATPDGPDAGRRPPPTKTTFGGDRPVELLVPPDYDHSVPAPLVLVLHGYTANGQLQLYFLGFDKLPELAGALVAAPDGTLEPRGGRRFWNATEACCDFEDTGVDDDAYLSGLIREISAEYNVDPRRTFLIGHSNGGFMSNRLACDHADLVAGIVNIAGSSFLDPERCKPAKPVSYLQVHGDADGTVLYDGSGTGNILDDPYPGAVELVGRWADANGCTGALEAASERLDLDGAMPGSETRVERTAGCPAGLAADLWTLESGPHIPAFNAGFAGLAWAWMDAHARR